MLQFSQFELDSRRGRLWRNGKRRRMPRAAMQLLVCLAANAGEVVERRVLAEHIWGKATDAADRRLNAAVGRLRKALGDTGIDPKLVVTVPGQGYQLAASIESSQDGGQHVALAKPDVRRSLGIAAAAAAVMAAAYAMTTLVQHRPDDATTAVPAVAEGDYRAAQSILAADGSGDLARAGALLNEALAAAPDYADAWAAMATLRLREPLPPSEAMPRARQAALTALTHDADNVTAKLRLADVAIAWERDWAQAREYVVSARDSAPDNSATHRAMAALHFLNGRPQEGEAALLMGLATEPESLPINADMAWYYTVMGRYEKAIDACNRLARLRRETGQNGTCALQPLLLSGKASDAAELARGALERATGRAPGAALAPEAVLSLFWRNTLVGLTETARARYVDPVQFARLHAQLGDRSGTLAALAEAVEQRSLLAPRAHLFPEFAPLHSEPAFLALLREAGVPEDPRQVIARLR